MKKKPVWMACLLIAMLCAVICFRWVEDMRFQGLRIKSGEQLQQMTENLQDVSSGLLDLQNTDELIELNGKAIPYDRIHNVFYVSQSMQSAEYIGTFREIREDCSVYIQQDDLLQDKLTAIREGHSFRLWFVGEREYAVADLIYTGLPVISVDSESGGLKQEYRRGAIVVQYPDDKDVITMSVKDSAMLGKINYRSGTISFKLRKEDDQEERNLNLLGLGKHTSWKLYQVHDRDDSACREMLSSYVWNSVCEEEMFHRKMEYAEVIVDGAYSGLYYLTPRLGKGYLNLGEEDKLYKVETDSVDDVMESDSIGKNIEVSGMEKADRAEALRNGSSINYQVVGEEENEINRQVLQTYLDVWNDGNRDYTQINAANYVDYHIWLQTVCSVRGSKEDYCIIAREKAGDEDGTGNYEFNRIPERSKFVFGIYPSEIGWQSLHAAETVMEDRPYDKMAETLGNVLAEEISWKWRMLREGALSVDAMRQYLSACERELMASGYIVRNGNPEEFEAQCLVLEVFVEQRLNYLDGFYDNMQNLAGAKRKFLMSLAKD